MTDNFTDNGAPNNKPIIENISSPFIAKIKSTVLVVSILVMSLYSRFLYMILSLSILNKFILN